MNYTSKTYDDTNKGVLYANNEKGKDKWIITNQGKLNIDGQEDRIIAVRRKNKDGQYILELYKAMGTLKENENKNGENDPDAKGIVNKLANEDSVIFGGRLAEYKYYDMHQVIASALSKVAKLLENK